MKETAKNIIKILENNGISIYKTYNKDGEYQREIEFYSPEGEDCIFTVYYDGTIKGLVKGFSDLANDFAPDEHAEMWINARDTVTGVPQNIRDLIDDAENIQRFLKDIAEQLENALNGTEKQKETETEYYESMITEDCREWEKVVNADALLEQYMYLQKYSSGNYGLILNGHQLHVGTLKEINVIVKAMYTMAHYNNFLED